MRLVRRALQDRRAQPARLVLMARKAYRVTLALPEQPAPLDRQARPVHKAILVLRAQPALAFRLEERPGKCCPRWMEPVSIRRGPRQAQVADWPA